jgi:hypothetical protein
VVRRDAAAAPAFVGARRPRRRPSPGHLAPGRRTPAPGARWPTRPPSPRQTQEVPHESRWKSCSSKKIIFKFIR